MNSIKNTLEEFEKFIGFNETEKPILSAKQQVFGRKDDFKLNLLLENKKPVNAPNYNQEQYPAVDLMFSIALLSKLYVKGKDEKGKLKLIKTPRLESFQSLNGYEKYVFLLQAYWTKYDFEEKFFKRFIYVFYALLYDIGTAKPGDKIVKVENKITVTMFSGDADLFHHLVFFGFGTVELIEGANGSYEDSIRCFYPNNFGIETIRLLLKDALPYFNAEDLSNLLTALKMEVISKKNQDSFQVFKNIFQEGLVENTVNKEDKKGVYTFKVSLSKSLWRKISLSHKHTLADLHLAIQKAFSFDNNHLYAFYIGDKKGKPIYCEAMKDKGKTKEASTIESLEFYKGETMVYFFDFGDQWEFMVELIEISEEEAIPLKPVIVEEKGEAPEQYYDGEGF